MSPVPLQLQNSKAVIQSKDTTIQELKEKIAYLEAEVCVLGRPGKGAGSGSRREGWAGGGSCCSEVRTWGVGPSSDQLSKHFLRTVRGLLAKVRPVPTLKGCIIMVQAPCPGSAGTSPSF